MSSTQIGISMNEVKKGFGAGATRIEVLRGVNLEAHCGEMLLLVGPSGCGKTTLLSVVSGLLDADSGNINIFGEQLEKMTSAQKTYFRQKSVGFVFQQFNLLPTLTAAENAAIPLLIRKTPFDDAVRKAADLLDRVGMGHRAHALPAELSGGEQQRVAIARSLITDPRLLLCDEPTAALDGETGQTVMGILRSMSLADNRCVIVVTHDARVFPFGDRMAHMVDGRIVSTEVSKRLEDNSKQKESTLCGNA